MSSSSLLLQYQRLMDWKLKSKKIILLMFTCVGAGVFLGALGCFHYNTNPRSFFSTSYCSSPCPPSRIVVRHDDNKSAFLSDELTNIKTDQAPHHRMSDDELLWKASIVYKRRKGTPVHRIPKVAFLFLSRGPLPLAPLWEHFFATYEGFYSIYVHADPDYAPNVTSSSVFHNRNVPSQVGD
jgi:hypothetical protein